MKSFVSAVVMALGLSAGAATAATVDFSTNNNTSLVHGSVVDGAFDFGDGITGTISTLRNKGSLNNRDYVAGRAMVFDTDQTGTQDSDLESPTAFGGTSAATIGNALIISEDNATDRGPDDEGHGGVITFMFDKLVSFSGVNLIDLEGNNWVRITGDGFASGDLTNEDNEYSFFAPDSPVLTNYLSFEFRGSGALDNLQVSAVPLPASVAFLLAGLGGLGLMRRRQS